MNAPNDPSTWHAKYFTDPEKTATDGASAEVFVARMREVLKIRDELSPQTKVSVDELGTFNDVKTTEEACRANEPYQAYHPLYWNAIGANWAYIFIASEQLSLPLFSMSQMIGYPTQCPSISMFDKDTAKPNAHYWVLSLINNYFGPGDKLTATTSSSPDVQAQAAIGRKGHSVLLVNTTERSLPVDLATSLTAGTATAEIVDQASGENAPRHEICKGQASSASALCGCRGLTTLTNFIRRLREKRAGTMQIPHLSPLGRRSLMLALMLTSSCASMHAQGLDFGSMEAETRSGVALEGKHLRGVAERLQQGG